MNDVGVRVGVIASANEDKVFLIGYGVRLHDEIPVGAGGMGILLEEEKIPNVTILLDSGEKVYGCECWWEEEKAIKSFCEGKQVFPVSLRELRNQ